ncbi:glycosyltransferase family 39 protein [Nostoc sp. FACHB-152]|uniref:ArnT family glycosyltransferase n=1 Tax=unclassified Nostoc TaxID=2593658 RepID=UPI0016874A50|nr:MULTISPECIES: glycosyltransferase family 39 protein [unclassified Nostoc]MBD2450183.1 glycosyltransferase family 39 protein [Nostoc sp. FACHB-152]MBD2469006.1 glycosyltransferase family 39 protein [Nostoc sp. FACHB-145]
MLTTSQFIQSIWRRIRLSAAFPYLSLLTWLVPLLLFTSGQNSLMAHDEGLYAWRARQMLDSGDWIAPWGTVHHKTPGPYWIIASAYKLFGMSEVSGRATSAIAGIFCLLLTYEIGKIFIGKKLAWLAAAILSVEFLWLQYCRLGTPDMPMIFLVLLAIFSLFQAELQPKYASVWRFIAGLCLGFGFLVRSFMIFLPAVALLPYLIGEHRRHRHLASPILYLGLLLGFIPTLSWLWFSWQRFGSGSLDALLQFVLQLGSEEREGNGIIFYFWNIPLKAFPWVFFSILGFVVEFRRPILHYHLLLVGFPIVLFIELSIFSTRLSHYSLCLYPFIALLAALGLDWLSKVYEKTKPATNISRNLSYGFGGLGFLLLLAGICILIWGNADIRKYAPLGLIVGLGWLMLPAVWLGRHHFGYKFLTARYWLAGWLIPCWLALAVAGSLGLIGDYNPAFRSFFQQRAIASIIQTHPIYFVKVYGKNAVLLNFYTPIHGSRLESISELPASSYAWIDLKNAPELSRPHRVFGQVKGYQLIQIMP